MATLSGAATLGWILGTTILFLVVVVLVGTVTPIPFA